MKSWLNVTWPSCNPNVDLSFLLPVIHTLIAKNQVKRNFLLTYDQSLLAPELQERLSEAMVGERPETHVLYIGDHAQQLSRSLSSFSYEGPTLGSAFKAYCYLKQELKGSGEAVPMAILCDEQLPDGDAFVLYDRLKSLAASRQIPFIILSKQPTVESKLKSLHAGIDDYFGPDVHPREIDQCIAFLRQHKAEINQQQVKEGLAVELANQFIPASKRAFDILVAGVALIMLSPIMLLIALLVKLDSRGPVFYISRRVGTGYNVFNFYKFRSMRQGADKELKNLMHLNQYNAEPQSDDISPELTEESCIDCLMGEEPCSPIININGKELCENQHKRNLAKAEKEKATFVKFENDPRVTPLGRFIRKTSLDELPQLLNVLKGDMSIVGNRPLPLYEAEKLTTDQWAKRFLAPAGITGLWQVTKRGQADMSTSERMQLDVTYASEYSFWYDLKIILKTLPAMVQKESV
jgi:lipopolysaccharide/colanic/teichoic acid biosynthesis glycosyltransferase